MSSDVTSVDQLPDNESPQLDLFMIPDVSGSPKRYSNTIEVYDALPKYIWDSKREFDPNDPDKVLQIQRSCTVRKHRYDIILRPAIIERRVKPKERAEKGDIEILLIYPGSREAIVEDVLRKIAVDGNASMHQENAGVIFTLYQVQQELQKIGRKYSIVEIKEALAVCRGCTLICTTEDGEVLVDGGLLSWYALSTRKDWKLKGSDAKCAAAFNPLVTRSILDTTYRKYNYSLGKSFKSDLAEFIHKRMSHYWGNADDTHPYTPKLVSFLSGSPRGLSPRMPENQRAMKTALDLLVKHEIILYYESVPEKKGRQVVNVSYTIYPHPKFVAAMKDANRHQKLIIETINTVKKEAEKQEKRRDLKALRDSIVP